MAYGGGIARIQKLKKRPFLYLTLCWTRKEIMPSTEVGAKDMIFNTVAEV